MMTLQVLYQPVQGYQQHVLYQQPQPPGFAPAQPTQFVQASPALYLPQNQINNVGVPLYQSSWQVQNMGNNQITIIPMMQPAIVMPSPSVYQAATVRPPNMPTQFVPVVPPASVHVTSNVQLTSPQASAPPAAASQTYTEPLVITALLPSWAHQRHQPWCPTILPTIVPSRMPQVRRTQYFINCPRHGLVTVTRPSTSGPRMNAPTANRANNTSNNGNNTVHPNMMNHPRQSYPRRQF